MPSGGGWHQGFAGLGLAPGPGGTMDGQGDAGSVETHTEGGSASGHFLVGATLPPQLRPNGYQLIPSPEP